MTSQRLIYTYSVSAINYTALALAIIGDDIGPIVLFVNEAELGLEYYDANQLPLWWTICISW